MARNAMLRRFDLNRRHYVNLKRAWINPEGRFDFWRVHVPVFVKPVSFRNVPSFHRFGWHFFNDAEILLPTIFLIISEACLNRASLR